MNKLGEEEIIKDFISITNSIYFQGYVKDTDGKISDNLKLVLDLYQKEKEKNKKLEEGLKYRVKYCGLLERELYGNENIELTKIEQELLEEE